MRSAARVRAFVCLDCRLRQSQHVRRRFQSNVTSAQQSPQLVAVDLSTGFAFDVSKQAQKSPAGLQSQPKGSQSKGKAKTLIAKHSSKKALPVIDDAQPTVPPLPDDVASGGEGHIKLPELFCINAIISLRQRLEKGIAPAENSKAAPTGVSFEDAVKATTSVDETEGLEKAALDLFKKLFAKQPVSKFMDNTKDAHSSKAKVQRKVLREVGIGTEQLAEVNGKIQDALKRQRERRLSRERESQMEYTSITARRVDTSKGPLMHAITSSRPTMNAVPIEDEQSEPPPKGSKDTVRSISKLDSSKSQLLRGEKLEMEPLELDAPTVPGLSFDLSRVLFNPGVYQLQDPRSRVFNFSPYLQHILPVSEFNFDALNEYITSSRDPDLRKFGKQRQKKYLGSSSSMTGLLTHFHFLLSAWRPINVETLSKSFTDTLRSFTQFQRGPSAVFLRYKDGIYAVDADKEYDSANILMSLGKSMEKLLTLEEKDFERYRKSAQEQGVSAPVSEPEVYHYTELGDFLLRSQLDAYDSRLPGTGMFDLKTRAVVSIRMNVSDHESGMGYEIQNRFGDFESYEREYYDMIRSAFLKYSLQVRMGRMDGIFVAYHNIERIFGFQYISLPEMDLHLHGTQNLSIGDTEFKLSLGLVNEIFDKATAKMPKTSLRFHFETRDSTGAEGSFMYIFAEAQSEEDIENIQNARKTDIAEFESRIFNTSSVPLDVLPAGVHTMSPSEPEEATDDEGADDTELPGSVELKANAIANSDRFSQPPGNKLMGLTLRILNKVNGRSAIRPVDLDKNDTWDIEYTLEEMSDDKALATYNQCRGRRAKLQNATQRDDGAANYYLRSMREMSQNGRSVRRKLDRADAEKPIVMLDRVPREVR
jgi:hypothetical protein